MKDGWGVTSNGTHLIVGDSSEFLYFLDPDTLEIVEKLKVLDNNLPVRWINELEFIDNLIYGNIYYTDCIAQIDSTTGGVVGWIRMDVSWYQRVFCDYIFIKRIIDTKNGCFFKNVVCAGLKAAYDQFIPRRQIHRPKGRRPQRHSFR